MVGQFSDNVFFVQGALNGAFYDLARERVFSVNERACRIIKTIIEGGELDQNGIDYRCQLQRAGLFDSEISPKWTKEDDLLNPPCSSTFDLVWLELTQRCNMRCLHCYEGDVHQRIENRLSCEDWFHAIDQVVAMGTKGIVVIGGEPSMHPDVITIVRYLHATGQEFSFFTNATFDDENLKQELISAHAELRVSLYGHCAEVHDLITRKKGSFHKTICNINWFRDHGARVFISVIFMKENECFHSEILKFVKNLGVSGFKFDILRKVFGGRQGEHMPESERMKRIGRLTEPKFKITKRHFFNALHYNPCWNRKIVISEDGSVLPCEFARNIVVGNIRESPLQNIVQSEKLQQCWSLSMDKIKVCNSCEFRYACKDCRPSAMAATNCLTDKIARCNYDPTTGVWNNA